MTDSSDCARTATSVVVLDLDDTLYLERDYVLSGFSAVGQWLAAEYGIENFSAVARDLFRAGRRGDIFDAALAVLGISTPPGLVEQLVTVYREHEPDIALLPDAERFIDRCSSRRALAMLTDGPLVTQENKIRALGIDGKNVFPIVCTGLWGRDYWKPHQRGFNYIEEHYSLPPAAFVYVADNPAKDFIAPRALGWRAVQIIRPEAIHPHLNPNPVDLVITSLDELTDERLDDLLGPRPGDPAARQAVDHVR